MPQQSFSVSNFSDYVVTGSVKRTMKNTITRKPCSFAGPFVSLRTGHVTHGAVEPGCNLTRYREGCCPPVGPKPGKAWLLAGRASHVMFCSWHPSASWWIKWEQLPSPATTVAKQPCRRGVVKTSPHTKAQGRDDDVNELAVTAQQWFMGHWHNIRLKGEGMSLFQLWVSGLLSAGPWLVGLTQPCYMMHSRIREIHWLAALQIMYKPMTSTKNTCSSRAANIFIINCYQKCQLKVIRFDRRACSKLTAEVNYLPIAWCENNVLQEWTDIGKQTDKKIYFWGRLLIWSGRKHWA